MRTLLFDIDGTLLQTNGGGSNAMKMAMEREFGLESARIDVSFSGRTDRSLLAELLQHNGIQSDETYQNRLRDSYTDLFPGVLASRGGRLLPGALELVRRLSRESSLRCYVMTGNLHVTARQKLEHFGLLDYFRGVFGGDHDADRNRLATRTADMLRDRYGENAAEDVVVIGDTPADIRCGHAIGARVVAVCTGSHDRAELESESPSSVHDDLSHVSEIFGLLTEPPSQSSRVDQRDDPSH